MATCSDPLGVCRALRYLEVSTPPAQVPAQGRSGPKRLPPQRRGGGPKSSQWKQVYQEYPPWAIGAPGFKRSRSYLESQGAQNHKVAQNGLKVAHHDYRIGSTSTITNFMALCFESGYNTLQYTSKSCWYLFGLTYYRFGACSGSLN